MADETTDNHTPEEAMPAAAEETTPAAAEETTPAAAEETPAEPEEGLSPKERRRRGRSLQQGEARPQRTGEERQEERRERRRARGAARRRRRAQEREKARTTGPREGTAPAEPPAGTPQTRQGTVVSSKADKTITVRVDIAKRHPRYQKIVRSSKTLHVHDERNEAGEGDVVRVVESRPTSRTKRWRLVEILERAK